MDGGIIGHRTEQNKHKNDHKDGKAGKLELCKGGGLVTRGLNG